MTARHRVLVFVGLAIVVTAVMALGAVSSAPAGNRAPNVLFDDFPGPDEVTFGENVAYTTSLENFESSMYTGVLFKMDRPSTLVNGQTLFANLVYASCEPSGPPFTGLTTTGFSCPIIAQVPSGSPPVQVTLVWQVPTPANQQSLSCDNPLVTDCVLTATGAWSIKEKQPGSNDTFAVGETTDLLLQPDPTRSGGYAIEPVTGTCTFATASLVTNPSVGAANKLATAVCPSTVPGKQANPLDPGLVIEITEGPGPGITDSSTICIPAPGELCDDPLGYTPYLFSPPATFSFIVDQNSLPKGEKVDRIVHNGVDVTGSCTITPINNLKITVVVCTAPTQGRWDMF